MTRKTYTAAEARALLEGTTPGPLLTPTGWPRVDAQDLCVSCGVWAPPGYSGGHDHEEGCAAEAQQRAFLRGRLAMEQAAPDLARTVVALEKEHNEARAMMLEAVERQKRAEAECDEARARAAEMHRRAQAAEGALHRAAKHSVADLLQRVRELEEAHTHKNAQLRAVRHVFCSGGCGNIGGEGPLTEEEVRLAIRNTRRLVTYFEGQESRALANLPTEDGVLKSRFWWWNLRRLAEAGDADLLAETTNRLATLGASLRRAVGMASDVPIEQAADVLVMERDALRAELARLRQPVALEARPEVGESDDPDAPWVLDLHDAEVGCPDQATALRLQGWWDEVQRLTEALTAGPEEYLTAARRAGDAEREVATLRAELARLRPQTSDDGPTRYVLAVPVEGGGCT